MQIVIPMSGFGERFRRAGYSVPKPLIEIDGKPIVEHVVEMFPGGEDFVFVCNRDHLADSDLGMAAVLRRIAPGSTVVPIAPHKRGPVHAVLEAASVVDHAGPVVVNYCDFTCYWDWQWFRRFVSETACAGAIPAYRGFHPHSLGSTNYAYLKEQGGWVTDIREKEPFTPDRMSEYASSGTYYFATGSLLLEACATTVERDLNVAGEYYVSLAYHHLLDESLPVAVYPLQHFMQWGTPEDVREYEEWSRYFRELASDRPEPIPTSSALVVPMAGLGQRFRDEGYDVPKPSVLVSGRPMVVQATGDVGASGPLAFVVRDDMQDVERLIADVQSAFASPTIVRTPGPTDGQAISALIGLDALEAQGPLRGPVTFAACDNGMISPAPGAVAALIAGGADVIVWVVRGHASAMRAPEMFGWVDEEGGVVSGVSVKVPLDDPTTDPVVTGTFTFRTAEIARTCIDRLVSLDHRVNGEFYLDSTVNDAVVLGLDCRTIEVTHYVSWGTPNDLRTFEYWQSCFHKWDAHPYRLGGDHHVPTDQVAALAQRFDEWAPAIPAPRGAS